jgi:hypothetical protein
MVQHENLLGMPIDKGDRLSQLALVNQDIIDEAARGQGLDPRVEVRAQDIVIVRFILDDVPARDKALAVL